MSSSRTGTTGPHRRFGQPVIRALKTHTSIRQKLMHSKIVGPTVIKNIQILHRKSSHSFKHRPVATSKLLGQSGCLFDFTLMINYYCLPDKTYQFPGNCYLGNITVFTPAYQPIIFILTAPVSSL